MHFKREKFNYSLPFFFNIYNECPAFIFYNQLKAERIFNVE